MREATCLRRIGSWVHVPGACQRNSLSAVPRLHWVREARAVWVVSHSACRKRLACEGGDCTLTGWGARQLRCPVCNVGIQFGLCQKGKALDAQKSFRKIGLRARFNGSGGQMKILSARALLSGGYVVQGAALANTEIEKYLKTGLIR